MLSRFSVNCEYVSISWATIHRCSTLCREQSCFALIESVGKIFIRAFLCYVVLAPFQHDGGYLVTVLVHHQHVGVAVYAISGRCMTVALPPALFIALCQTTPSVHTVLPHMPWHTSFVSQVITEMISRGIFDSSLSARRRSRCLFHRVRATPYHGCLQLRRAVSTGKAPDWEWLTSTTFFTSADNLDKHR